MCDVFLMLGYGRRQTCHLIGWPVPNSPYNLSTPVSFGLLCPESAKLLHGGGQPEERQRVQAPSGALRRQLHLTKLLRLVGHVHI